MLVILFRYFDDRDSLQEAPREAVHYFEAGFDSLEQLLRDALARRLS